MITHPQFIRSFLEKVERSRATRPLTTRKVGRWAHAACASPTAGVQSMSDPFKEFVEEMARLAVPEDDTEENRGRREAAASESGTPISELDESDLVARADDEFLCSEALALWAMIRKARELVRQA
jgi:hypothetical protein